MHLYVHIYLALVHIYIFSAVSKRFSNPFVYQVSVDKNIHAHTCIYRTFVHIYTYTYNESIHILRTEKTIELVILNIYQ